MKIEELEKENEILKIKNENLKNAKKSIVQSFVETNPEREVSFMEYIFLLFLGLKLGGAIDWWYIFVFMPLIVIYTQMFVKILIVRGMINKMVKQRKEEIKKEDEDRLESIKKFAESDD